LSAELFFYALFPLIIVRLRPLSTRALATFGAAVAVVVIAFPIVVPDSNFARWLTYIFPAFRLLEFVLGCTLAILVRGGLRLPIWAAGVVVFGSWVGAGQMNLHAGRVSSVTLIGFAMLIVAAASSDLNGTSRLLRNQWAIRFGEWSFAFYLVHQLVIRAIDSQIDPAGSGEAILAAVVALVVSVALAATLFYVVERPLERRLRGDGTLPVTMTEADEPSAADTIIEEARMAELQGGIRQIRASSDSPRRKV
jgi:peptidoglycan/LPS O-acetylase OafA/YrhL